MNYLCGSTSLTERLRPSVAAERVGRAVRGMVKAIESRKVPYFRFGWSVHLSALFDRCSMQRLLEECWAEEFPDDEDFASEMATLLTAFMREEVSYLYLDVADLAGDHLVVSGRIRSAQARYVVEVCSRVDVAARLASGLGSPNSTVFSCRNDDAAPLFGPGSSVVRDIPEAVYGVRAELDAAFAQLMRDCRAALSDPAWYDHAYCYHITVAGMVNMSCAVRDLWHRFFRSKCGDIVGVVAEATSGSVRAVRLGLCSSRRQEPLEPCDVYDRMYSAWRGAVFGGDESHFLAALGDAMFVDDMVPRARLRGASRGLV